MNVYRPTTDKDTYQSMIGAAFGEKTVSAKSAFKVEDEGTLKIVKYAKDADGKADDSQPIKDVEFTITGPNDYSKTAKTDENGEISLSGLTPGKYTITESDVTDAEPKVEAPDVADKTQTVTVEADKTKPVTATFSDKLTKGNLEVVKYAKDADGNVDTSKPIKGVEFTITGPKGYSKAATTDEEGKISLQGLTPGEYTVTESSVDDASPAVEAPSADDKTQKVTVAADKTATAKVSFSDELKQDKTGTFTIQKYIKDTTTGVKGVQFKITGSDSQVDGKTFTTDKDGKITLPTELKSGKYTITELTTPGDGFTDTVELLAQTKTITIKADGTTSAANDTVVFEDNAKASSSSSSESSSSSTSSNSSSSMSSSSSISSSSSSESSSSSTGSSTSSSMSSSSSLSSSSSSESSSSSTSSSSSSENSSSSTSSSSSLPVSSESSSSETSSSSSDSSSAPVTPAESSSSSGTEISGVESSSTTSTSANTIPTTPSAPATSASSAKKSFVSGLLPQTGQAKSLLWILLGVVIVAGVAIKLYLDKKKIIAETDRSSN
jgi:LPXTG-motif cell wall-anchored protein